MRRSSRAVKKTVFLNPSYASPAALAAPSPATKKKTAKSKKKIAPAAPSPAPATKKKTAANQEEAEDKMTTKKKKSMKSKSKRNSLIEAC